MEKSNVINRLLEKVCLIEFEKADGSVRKMKATMNADMVPPATKEDPLSQKKVRAVNEDVHVVWDVDAEGWRSFRWDRLKQVDGDRFVV